MEADYATATPAGSSESYIYGDRDIIIEQPTTTSTNSVDSEAEITSLDVATT